MHYPLNVKRQPFFLFLNLIGVQQRPRDARELAFPGENGNEIPFLMVSSNERTPGIARLAPRQMMEGIVRCDHLFK